MRNNCYKFLIIQQNKFFQIQCKLIIIDQEIIACKLELFKNPIIGFIIMRSAQKGRGQQLDFCNWACAMNSQNYAPCHLGIPSLNSYRDIHGFDFLTSQISAAYVGLLLNMDFMSFVAFCPRPGSKGYFVFADEYLQRLTNRTCFYSPSATSRQFRELTAIVTPSITLVFQHKIWIQINFISFPEVSQRREGDSPPPLPTCLWLICLPWGKVLI